MTVNVYLCHPLMNLTVFDNKRGRLAWDHVLGGKVTREDRTAANGIRDKLKRMLSERGVDSWDVSKRQRV